MTALDWFLLGVAVMAVAFLFGWSACKVGGDADGD